MSKELTPEQYDDLRPRVVVDLRIVVNRGDVPIISNPCEECTDGDEDLEKLRLTEIIQLREENRILRDKLSGIENS